MSTPVKPDITPYLEAIENAVYGEEVRGSIHDAIEAVNDYADEFYTDAKEQATAAANSASDASGYATTASNKAGEASASATAAGNAETAAKNAKTDAVDAKNLANEYAGNAASSAAQAAASAQAAAAAGPILVDTVGWMCKNRVPLTLESLKALNTLGTWADNVYTRNDVDFTVNTNSDGYVTSIVMNGTASGFASLTMLDDTIANLSEFLPQGNYIVNGCPDGGAMLSGYSMRFKVNTETYYITDSDDMTVAVSGSSSYQVTWSLACTSGTSVSSKTFEPMIRKSAIADNTFYPYHKSVEDWYWENNAELGNVHQFIPFDKALMQKAMDYGTWNGNVFTVNSGTVTINPDDETVTIDGTFSETSEFRFFHRNNNSVRLPDGDYIISGGSTGLSVVAGCTRNGGYQMYTQSTGADAPFTILSTDGNTACSISITAGTYSNVKIKPLIRKAVDTCKDHTKYAMSNEELTGRIKLFNIPVSSLAIDSAWGSAFTGNVSCDIGIDLTDKKLFIDYQNEAGYGSAIPYFGGYNDISKGIFTVTLFRFTSGTTKGTVRVMVTD